MQMITRRVNESLVIGSDIHVTVLDICKNSVRLAISSPKHDPQYWEQTLYWNDAQEDDQEELVPQSEIAEPQVAEPLLLQ
jgi:carbon storage regulator CsrA